MAYLYGCLTCGFLSALPSSYRVREGVLVCKSCSEAIDRRDPKVCKWLAENLRQPTDQTEDGRVPWTANVAMRLMWSEMDKTVSSGEMMKFLQKHLQAAFEAGRDMSAHEVQYMSRGFDGYGCKILNDAATRIRQQVS